VRDAGDVVIRALIVALEDAVPEVRVRAMNSLGNIGSKALPFLVNALDLPNTDVQGRAVIALAAIGTESLSAFPRLTALLEHGASFVALQSAIALSRMGDAGKAKLIEVLNSSLTAKEFERAHHCVTALGTLNPTSEDDICLSLVDAYFRGNERIRIDAASCLGIRLGTNQAEIPAGKVAEMIITWMSGERKVAKNRSQ
jgi:HEAT repeat protein